MDWCSVFVCVCDLCISCPHLMQRDLVGDELDHLTEQYQQISTAFETQTKDLLSAQVRHLSSPCQ